MLLQRAGLFYICLSALPRGGTRLHRPLMKTENAQPGHHPAIMEASAAKPWPRRISGKPRKLATCAKNNDVRNANTKPVVPVEVVRVVPVAVRTAGVPVIVDERPAAQNAVPLDAPFTTRLAPRV